MAKDQKCLGVESGWFSDELNWKDLLPTSGLVADAVGNSLVDSTLAKRSLLSGKSILASSPAAGKKIK